MSTTKFKIGDRVRFKESEYLFADEHRLPRGGLVISAIDDKGPEYGVVLDFAGYGANGGAFTTRVEFDPTPTPAQDRKNKPLARGFLDYFPDAAMAVAEVSRVGNEQHHPGAPIHWEKGKSQDHADCCARHLLDRGTLDTDGMSHTAKVAWRAMALLQTELEAADPELAARRQEQRDRAARGGR